MWQEPVLAIFKVARTGSRPQKKVLRVLNCDVIGSGKNQFLLFSEHLETVLRREVIESGKNQFLPFLKRLEMKFWEVARTDSCHFSI